MLDSQIHKSEWFRFVKIFENIFKSKLVLVLFFSEMIPPEDRFEKKHMAFNNF